MRMTKVLAVVGACVAALIVGHADNANGLATTTSQTAQNPTPSRMRAFASDDELTAFLRKFAAERKRQTFSGVVPTAPSIGGLAGAPAPAPPAMAEAVSVAGAAADSITNVQHAGVDEGGIVKMHGEHLVVLRRGRLFTIAIGNGQLTPVSSVNAFGPDIDPRGTWYDEMLVADDTVVVIGYSYSRGGTEIGLFRIDDEGRLRYRSTYHLRSNDYYSSRNYSSRLIGSKLVFYTPLYLQFDPTNQVRWLPALRRWRPGATESDFRSIVTASRIYRAEYPIDPMSGLALHTVTSCDLARDDMSCTATAVVGAPGRVFYVSPESVYVWTSEWVRSASRVDPRSMLYQLPLDGSTPGALRVVGSPVDQFSFLESDRHLHVLVRSNAAGDGMWAAEVARGDVALMRVPLNRFGDGREAVPANSFRSLPRPEGYTFQNRFIARHLLYGTGSGWGRPKPTDRPQVYAVRWDGRGEIATLPLPHGVDRIEALGSDAAVIGTDGNDLHFTSVRLDDRPRIAGRYTQQNAAQGELRSHGFFYRATANDQGLLGLPIRGGGRPGYEHLRRDSASVLFLRNRALQLTDLGALDSQAESSVDDGCKASCVDWYGNARPLFVRDRVLALLGYEVVEGLMDSGRIHEMRRINYAPPRRGS